MIVLVSLIVLLRGLLKLVHTYIHVCRHVQLYMHAHDQERDFVITYGLCAYFAWHLLARFF